MYLRTRGRSGKPGVCLNHVSVAGIHHHRPPDFSSFLPDIFLGWSRVATQIRASHLSTSSTWTVVYRNGSSLMPALTAGQAPSRAASARQLASTFRPWLQPRRPRHPLPPRLLLLHLSLRVLESSRSTHVSCVNKGRSAATG